MCKRCSNSRQGYKSAHEVSETTGRAHTSPLWIRELWPEDPTAYPRYLVEQGGRVVAIQEPDCPCWHIRTADDDHDVNDNLPPVADDFDKYLEDEGSAFQFDTVDTLQFLRPSGIYSIAKQKEKATWLISMPQRTAPPQLLHIRSPCR